MALNRKKDPALIRLEQELKAKQAELDKAKADEEKRERDAKALATKEQGKHGAEYVLLMQDLCDELGVLEEHPYLRAKRGGGTVEISSDPTGALRLARLREALDELIESADEAVLQRIAQRNRQAIDERRDKREADKAKTATESAETDDEADDDEGSEVETAAGYGDFGTPQHLRTA